MKNSSDTIGNQTHDLPACSAVSQPTTPPRAPNCKVIRNICRPQICQRLNSTITLEVWPGSKMELLPILDPVLVLFQWEISDVDQLSGQQGLLILCHMTYMYSIIRDNVYIKQVANVPQTKEHVEFNNLNSNIICPAIGKLVLRRWEICIEYGG
jgi:hypothetical protein